MVFRFSTNSQTLASSSEEDNLRKLVRYTPSTVSVIPIINQWVNEGKTVDYEDLKKAIKYLRAVRRFNHALQVFLSPSKLLCLFSLILKRVDRDVVGCP